MSSRRHLLVGALALTASLGYVAQRGSSFRRHLRAANAATAGPTATAELQAEVPPPFARRLWGLPEVHVPGVGGGGGKKEEEEEEEEEHATDDHGAHGDDHGAHGDDHGHGALRGRGMRSKPNAPAPTYTGRPALPL